MDHVSGAKIILDPDRTPVSRRGPEV